ncbi:hypothetical protein PDE_05346 [Penicillium oxalicum 114-2]|uniref:Uncharacterized protein n=1 Tax=Penicillium oxalicum (strain 114-2 / CGMCC 5302) TaxID=933388 RepID=S7ZIE2_PENO1|nr:hypothetical protein PDE_05346 [Penicillium oxalicum 114-2]
MAPIRRYLRISKHSVLECRIYLDNPSDSRWLLNPRDPVLYRIFEAIRPLVLPKLREENRRLWARKKSKPVKDVITQDEFEVAIFLRESRTRHALLTRNKIFHTSRGENARSVKAEPADETMGDVTDPDTSAEAPVIVDSDESEAEIDLRNIPEATGDGTIHDPAASSRSQRDVSVEDETTKDEKKMRFNTQYESFNITGWVLCLLVTRKGERIPNRTASTPMKQPLMEEWISSQAQTGLEED